MSKFKIGDKVIVREGVSEWVYQAGAKGIIVRKTPELYNGFLVVEFYEGTYTKNKGKRTGKWGVHPTWVKSLEKGKARPPKKPITSITKKHKAKYKNIVTASRYLDIIGVYNLKDTERALMELRRKGFEWIRGGGINEKFFTKRYKATTDFKPIYLFVHADGKVSWRRVKDGSWIYKRI
ncbi:hypothetical protein KLF37_07160 [Clostridium perfringens]|uniref:hypothetical protein n=1 Tax=Clostridium perfringens TaxID=1502 RepID=UPI001CCBF1A2|nr:hypothetical protein [Clostridium perfringens]UBK93097.1 hypothetical protein KLF37_07160 [Clostridium perfringens]